MMLRWIDFDGVSNHDVAALADLRSAQTDSCGSTLRSGAKSRGDPDQ
jgi:hypothetical protein